MSTLTDFNDFIADGHAGTATAVPVHHMIRA